jgi:hypothetical protein
MGPVGLDRGHAQHEGSFEDSGPVGFSLIVPNLGPGTQKGHQPGWGVARVATPTPEGQLAFP